MTDRPRPYHRAEAERLLDYADEWAAQAGELSPKASERACLDRAQVHALLAIVDALTKPCNDCVKHDAYAAREAEQRDEHEAVKAERLRLAGELRELATSWSATARIMAAFGSKTNWAHAADALRVLAARWERQ